MIFRRNKRELAEIDRSINIVGLTGGIGSGKTVATDALLRAGFFVVDADEVSRELFARGTAGERELIRLFPQAAKDGALDRRALREIISRDARAKHTLDMYTHPLITDKVRRLIGEHKGKLVLSAPLLFESGLAVLCDITVCITAAKSTRIARIVARDGVSAAQAEDMINAQLHDAFRATLADLCVPSDGDKASFESEITELISLLFAK